MLKDVLGNISCRISFNVKAASTVSTEGVVHSSSRLVCPNTGTMIVAEGISGKDKRHVRPYAATFIVMDNALLQGARCLLRAGWIMQDNPADTVGAERVLYRQIADSNLFSVISAENWHSRCASVLSVNDTFFELWWCLQRSFRGGVSAGRFHVHFLSRHLRCSCPGGYVHATDLGGYFFH